ncbi:MAG: hypothetical protein L6R41_007761 [Letrouitia leprolyta]|nr:MAG: hypothetical protein L6R41_007761 [Letrouitia leprolyta]
MATLSSLRPLLALICCFSLLSATMAQEVQDASDLRATDNAPDTGNDFDLVFNIPVAEKTYKIAPLSDASSTLKTDLTGNLRVINPGNVNSLPDNTIAYISCDDDDSVYPGQIRAKETFNLAIHHSPPPISVLLYSINNKSCTLVPNNLRAPSIYSMQDKAWSDETLKQLQSNTTMMLNATISPDSSDGSGGGGILGKSPTTAVAMIILYSITGLITALFLIIIIVGAVRAHRHPERYGPRNVIGRPRQSRAKGIGRAILETFPLVKFGDHDNIKPGDQPRDIEMMPPQTTPQTSLQGQAQGAAASASDRRTTQEDTDAVTAEQVAGQETRPQPSGDPIENADNGLACSVCTDDFAKGQDAPAPYAGSTSAQLRPKKKGPPMKMENKHHLAATAMP